jgi:hypothetical protein
LKFFTKYLPFSALVVLGCTHNGEVSVRDSGENYFPVAVGQYSIFDVNEIQYSEVADTDTLQYELKTEVVDSFKNNIGTFTYVVHRSKRPAGSSEWQFLDTWSVRKDNNQVVQAEGNTSFVKLVFPPSKGARWNGNGQNGMEEDEYEVMDFDTPQSFNNLSFEKTATVEQEFNDDPIVYTDLRKEVYARGTGLVYKETTQLHFCTSEVCDRIIENGMIYKQTIKEYGVH